jgi:dTDP-4-dehydrorhamnose reductase
MGKRVLITGSSGMLGVNLSTELDGSYEIHGMDIASCRQPIAERFHECDITDRKGVSDVVVTLKPDIVVHMAAWTDVDGCELDSRKAYEINSNGTDNVAFACKSSGATLVYISTDFVFDGKKKAPYKEEDDTAPLSVYGLTKLKGEEAVRKRLKGYFILRTSWLFGACGKNFVDTIIDKARSGATLKVVDDQVGSPTYTKDLAKAIHILMGKSEYGIYHVSNSGSVSWYDYARAIISASHLSAKVEPISSGELGRPAKRPAMSVLDNSKFVQLTGYRMRPWKEAVEEYILQKKTV